ncbi:MAG: hypothetical protein PHT12_00305 [Patescibacteria group bacterium]|nr:hypothetical protein [Patescibacteria group bacterium]
MTNKPSDPIGLFILSALAYPIVCLLTKALPFLPAESPVYAVAAIAFITTMVNNDRSEGMAKRLWRGRTIPLWLGALLGLALVLTPLWAKMWHEGGENKDLLFVILSAFKVTGWVMGTSVAAIVLSAVMSMDVKGAFKLGWVFSLVSSLVMGLSCMAVSNCMLCLNWTDSDSGLTLALVALLLTATIGGDASDSDIQAKPWRFIGSQLSGLTVWLLLSAVVATVFFNSVALFANLPSPLAFGLWVALGSAAAIAMRVKSALEEEPAD